MESAHAGLRECFDRRHQNSQQPGCAQFDGIDPDHCRNVEIRNCEISCGDDAIVVKATRQKEDYGPLQTSMCTTAYWKRRIPE